MELNKEQKALIERFGHMMKSMGGSVAMGKILGYLIVSDPPHRSFDEIQADLKLSKGAVSNTLKIMGVQGLIEFFTVSGDRKRYFRLAIANRELMLARQISETDRFIAIMEDAISVRSPGNEGYEKELHKYIDMYKLLQIKILEVMKSIS